MFKPVNIFIGCLIAVFGYIFISYGGGVGNLLTADIFRTDKTISGDIYYIDNNGELNVYSNFDSEPGDLGLVLSRDNDEVTINTNQIKSDYSANITNISENMAQINIKKNQSFGPKAKLLTIKYNGKTENINISDAKMIYVSGSDMLAVTRL